MDKVIVFWKSYHKPEVLDRGYWDQGLLEDLFKRGNFEHHLDFDEVKGDYGAVVVINGRTHVEDVEAINKDIAKLSWVVLIITGDEEALFPLQDIKHPMLRTWVMLPRMNLHNDVSFKLPNGYRPETHDYLKEAGQQDRVIDFMFVGQINHARREQCLEAANAMPEQYRRFIVPTDSFGKEVVDYRTYILRMAQTKIALCPSGIESPDNFRLYEALEAGCVPIVDAFATNNQSWGFWNYLFGTDIPFPIVPYWDELPNILPSLLKDYPNIANKCFAWWIKKKRQIYNKLMDDIKELSNG